MLIQSERKLAYLCFSLANFYNINLIETDEVLQKSLWVKIKNIFGYIHERRN